MDHHRHNPMRIRLVDFLYPMPHQLLFPSQSKHRWERVRRRFQRPPPRQHFLHDHCPRCPTNHPWLLGPPSHGNHLWNCRRPPRCRQPRCSHQMHRRHRPQPAMRPLLPWRSPFHHPPKNKHPAPRSPEKGKNASWRRYYHISETKRQAPKTYSSITDETFFKSRAR